MATVIYYRRRKLNLVNILSIDAMEYFYLKAHTGTCIDWTKDSCVLLREIMENFVNN